MFLKLRAALRRTPTPTDNASTSAAVNTVEVNEKNSATDHTTAGNSNGEPQTELPSEELQRGVQDVEAVTITWSKTTLVAVFLKYVFNLITDPYAYLANNILLQYMATLFRQRIPILNSLQLTPVHHERIRISFAAECRIHCRKCHVSRSIYSFGKNYGRLG